MVSFDEICRIASEFMRQTIFQANNTGNPQSGADSYVSLPGSLVTSLNAVTFEVWHTHTGLNNGNRLISFGGPITMKHTFCHHHARLITRRQVQPASGFLWSAACGCVL